MKKLLVPAVAAIVAGLAGGSAFSYRSAKEAAKVVAAHVADSLAKVAHDSTAIADSVAKEEHTRELAAQAEQLPLTPADSIRLAQEQPTSLAEATHDLPNAVDPKHAPAPDAHKAAATATKTPATKAPATAAASHAPANAPKTVVPPNKGAAPAAPAAHAPEAHAPEAPAPAALESALPERRIAKIFGAMASKDAAKVLEQMSDNDVRVILGMMADKQAAAILTALPAARAAAISKGEVAKSPAKDEKKGTGGHP